VEPGRATPAAGAAQLRWLEQATELVRDGACAALTTGPISKKAVASSGLPKAARFRGHTEWLAERLAAREVVMAFTAGGDRAAKRPALTTALVTTHVPLARVAESITPAGVAAASFWLAELLVRLGYRTPHVVVAALNPHAGEEGLLGDEERRVIRPGIRRARRRLARRGLSAELTGPVGAETAFRRCVAGDYHGVVAMYHDQATIPCKLLGFGEAVNVSLGLPIVRTSVDHGTGYDIAGTGRASSAGMERAVQLAARLAAR